MRNFFRLLIITASAAAVALLAGCAAPMAVTVPVHEEIEHDSSDVIKIESYSLKPQTAHPGAPIEISVQYALRLPKRKNTAEVTEIRTLVMGTENIELSRKKIIRSDGSHKSTIKFTLPMDIEKGDYTIRTVISTPAQTKTIEDTLTIIKRGR
ncbi:MAG: hypothetical protein L7F77_16610 [Candidatus Magnetominusculus sp. LBB02]|nr:hypothetical protein [Candidatus Magnetominusculus sp. LBB02]